MGAPCSVLYSGSGEEGAGLATVPNLCGLDEWKGAVGLAGSIRKSRAGWNLPEAVLCPPPSPRAVQ